MKKIIQSRLAKLPPKVAMPLTHLAKIGQMKEQDIKTVLDAGDLTGNPHTLVGFAAGAMGMKAQHVPVTDTVAMAKKLGRTIRLDWSPRRWHEEHDKMAKAVTLRQFRSKNVNYDVEFYAKSLPPKFPGYIIRNSLRLATVGWYQRHCVASYHSSCASGSSAIVCVFVDHTRWTVELKKTENPDYPIRITQIRTTDNRGPDPQTEQKIYEHLGIPEQVREIPEYIQRNREQCLLRNVTIVNLSRVHEALAKADGDSEAMQWQRDVEILSSLPGVGRIVLATLLAEAADLLQLRDYIALRAFGGTAPVTRRSGKMHRVVRRRAVNHRLQYAIYHWARIAVQHDPVSKNKYAALRARGHGHARALRSIADRLLKVACTMLTNQQIFDQDYPRHELAA